MVEITRIEHADELEDRAILDCIHAFVAQEHRIRAMLERGEASEAASQERLAEIERNLDHMWDLLRTRRAERAIAPKRRSAVVTA